MSKYRNIKKHLDKVRNSQCFSKSVVLKELLNYLVQKSLQGENPKEVEIAYAIFGKTYKSEKEKNIRVYVYNLRKKLKEYYQKEGLNDEITFSIPKGGYEVGIKSNSNLILKSRIAKISPYLFAFSCLLFLLSIFFFSGTRPHKITKSFIWNDIYQSNYPLLIVLGDHYFVYQRNIFGNMVSTRFVDINSDQDFDRLIANNPWAEKDLKKTSQTYINKQAPFGMYKIMNFLGGGNLKIDMRYSSELQWEHLEDSNTLFIGSYKTQNILKSVFTKIGIQFQVKKSTVTYSTQDSTYTFKPHREGFLNQEFASLIHFETADGRIVMALMCNSDMGNIATVKYLTEPENLKKLKQLTAHYPNRNFKALFEVKGQREVDFELYLKHINPITADINEIWP